MWHAAELTCGHLKKFNIYIYIYMWNQKTTKWHVAVIVHYSQWFKWC